MGNVIAIVIMFLSPWLIISINHFIEMDNWGYKGSFFRVIWITGPLLYNRWYQWHKYENRHKLTMNPGMKKKDPPSVHVFFGR